MPSPLKSTCAAALFFSGAGCLIAQIAIQKYAQVVFGGLNVVTMYMISFSFIAGLAVGSLASAKWLARGTQSASTWACVEVSNAILVAPFILLFSAVVRLTFPIGKASYLASPVFYYGYALGILAVTTFVLASVMGANYPLAFKTVTARSGMEPYRAGLLVLAANTIGAAVGALIAIGAMPYVSLYVLITIAAVCYAASGALVACIARFSSDRAVGVGAPRGSTAQHSVRVGMALLFVSGFSGFAYETVMFRHFSLIAPYSYQVFGATMAAFLLFWGTGTALRSIAALSSRYILLGFAASIAIVWLLIIEGGFAHALDVTNWVSPLHRSVFLVAFFLPALLSGWYYAAAQSEIGEYLSSGSFAKLYAANLAGSFLGGLVAGVLLPSTVGFIYGIPMAACAAAILYVMLYRNDRAALAFAVVLALALLAPFVRGDTVLRYYRDFSGQTTLSDITEDWTGGAWVADIGNSKNFVVGGRYESPNFQQQYAGLRLFQVETVLAAKHNHDILMIGLALGASAGDLARKLPNSHIVVVDYSRAVVRLADKLAAFNSGVTRAPNVEVIAADGRMTTAVETRKFDIIMEMGSGDGSPGASTIKSAEFMQLVKARLRPDGFYVAFGRSPCTVRAVQSAFRHVYRHLAFAAGSDKPINTLFDFDKLRAYRAQFRMVPPAFAREGLMEQAFTDELRPLPIGRMTTDADPCSDFTATETIPTSYRQRIFNWPAWR